MSHVESRAAILEQEPTSTPSKNIFQRLLASSRARLAATFLALGGAAALTQSTTDERLAVPNQQQPKDSPSSPSLADILRHHPDISEVTIAKNVVQCSIKGTTYSGTLDKNGQLVRITCPDSDITFSTPIEESLMDNALLNIHHMRSRLPPAQKDQVRTFSSSDGVRFIFEETNDGKTELFIVVPTMLLKVMDQPNALSQQEWKTAALKLADHRKDIQNRLKVAVGDHQTQWRLRERNEWLEQRIAAIESAITNILENYREHPYLRVDWDTYLPKFHTEVDPLWKACQSNPNSIGFSAYEARLNALQQKLDSYEYWLGIDPGSPHINGTRALNALERQDRINKVTTRFDVLSSKLEEQIRFAPTEQQRSFWIQKQDALRREWNTLINQFVNERGWETWDPSPQPLEHHRALTQNIEKMLQPYEELLQITPPSTNDDILECFNQERTLFASEEEQEQRARMHAMRWRCQKQGPGNETVILIQDPLHQRVFTMAYRHKEGTMNEQYAQTQQQHRQWTSDDGNNRIRAYTSGGKTTSREWIRRDGRWMLAKQIHCRADGTTEWVSDAVKDHLEYFASDGTRLARMDYEDKGGRITLVSFFGKDGKAFSTFDREREADNTLTRDQYLDRLATELDTHEKLQAFLDIFMQYTSDDGDYWQSARETIERVIGGRMRGDCDDYAFLAREILRRQGKNAHATLVPRHATCIWVEQRKDGRFDAYSIGTYGLDKNGNRYGYPSSRIREGGYERLIDALNALMIKFRTRGLGLDQGQHVTLNENEIWFLEIYPDGHRGLYSGTANTFVH